MDKQKKEEHILKSYYELSKISKELFDTLKTAKTDKERNYIFNLIKLVENDFTHLLYI
jgi:hypothetical protein